MAFPFLRKNEKDWKGAGPKSRPSRLGISVFIGWLLLKIQSGRLPVDSSHDNSSEKSSFSIFSSKGSRTKARGSSFVKRQEMPSGSSVKTAARLNSTRFLLL